ncbi:hypothetical protein XENORESO_012481 [Xenotaenia resolanae]|uniref:Uncharacterized protein n=1 Tax=Xenotaenia resolanae TaxID=208358 RepID=A0ABV0WBZ1_9TELE
MCDKPPERLYQGRDSSLTTPPPPAREAPHALCARITGGLYIYLYTRSGTGAVTRVFKKALGLRPQQLPPESGRRRTEDRTDAALPGSAPDMQSLISPVTKAILVALFIFAILLILYVILWYICRDVDCDHGI